MRLGGYAPCHGRLVWLTRVRVVQLVFAKWAPRCRELFSLAAASLLAHLKSAHEQGHEEVGINLVPETAAESDTRYLELRGCGVGTVWAPNEQSPVINILAWRTIDGSFLSLLCKRFREEGFQVVMGTKAGYFRGCENAALLFLVVSWKNLHLTAFGKLVETVEGGSIVVAACGRADAHTPQTSPRTSRQSRCPRSDKMKEKNETIGEDGGCRCGPCYALQCCWPPHRPFCPSVRTICSVTLQSCTDVLAVLLHGFSYNNKALAHGRRGVFAR